MTRRRIPVVATAVVLLAVAAMIALGFWQLQRMAWKEALIERYRAAPAMSADAPWPGDDEAAAEPLLYRHARVDCREVRETGAIAGRNASGEVGFAHYALCALADGGSARIVIGWSREPKTPAWSGGEVGGVIAPGPRLIADPPLAGLAANARPDPADIPNNHLSYAVQWFLFAAVALVIYALALRQRVRGK